MFFISFNPAIYHYIPVLFSAESIPKSQLDKTVPCPIGFRANELNKQGKVIPNGYDPLEKINSVRCIGINKLVIYGEKECLMQRALGWLKSEPVKVNREGFTPDEMAVEVKRRENLTKQKEWEKANITRNVLIKNNEHNECQSWKNSQIIDPTPDKKRYIEEHCRP